MISHVLEPNSDTAKPTDVLVHLVDVGPLSGALLQHSSDKALDRVRVGGVGRDL